MDQRASDVEEDLRQILRTRVALSDKVETLERRVTAMANDTKAVAVDTVEAAKGKAMSWAEQTSRRLQARQRPLLWAGGAMVVALLTGLIRRRRSSGVHAYFPRAAKGAEVMPGGKPRAMPGGVHPFYSKPSESSAPYGRPMAGAPAQASEATAANVDRSEGQEAVPYIQRQLSSLWDDVSKEVKQEGARLQRTAMQIALSFLRDLTHIAGQTIVEQLQRSQGRRRPAGAETPRRGV